MEKKIKRQIEHDCIHYMRPSIWLQGVSDLLGIAAPTLTAFMIGDMADYLLELDFEKISGALLLFLAAFLINIFVTPVFELAENLCLTRNGIDYGVYLVKRFFNQPVLLAEEISEGEILERMSEDYISYYFNIIFKWSQPFVIVIYFVGILTVMYFGGWNPLFAAVLFVFSCFPVIRARRVGKRQAKLRVKNAEFEETRRNREYELYQAGSFFRGFHLGERMLDSIKELFDSFMQESGEKKAKLDAEDVVIDFLCGYGVQAAAVAIGAILMASGHITAGELFAGYLLLPSIQKCYGYAAKLHRERKAEAENRERLTIFYGEQEAENVDKWMEETAPAKEELLAENLKFSYPKEKKEILNGLDISLKEGKRIWLRGANGCGKSTLLQILCGLYHPQTGKIVDKTGNSLSVFNLRSSVALSEQGDAIFSGTVYENLFLPENAGDDGRKAALQLCEKLGFTKSLDEIVEAGGANLSPGERKKLCLMRVLLQEKPFLALDEPCNHLDKAGEEALIEILRERKQGILLISHDETLPEAIGAEAYQM